MSNETRSTCPTCQNGHTRRTVGMVCQACGTNYGAPRPLERVEHVLADQTVDAHEVASALLDVDEMAEMLHAADQGINGYSLPWHDESHARRESWRHMARALRAALLGTTS